MKKIGFSLLFSVLTLALVVTLTISSTPSAVAQDNMTLTAVRVETASTDPLDAAWAAVPSLNVALVGEADLTAPVISGITYDLIEEVALQAVYTDDMLYIRAVWPDATQNDNRKFWTYTESGWVKSPLNEDRIAFMFDITGNRQFNALGCGAVCHAAEGDVPAYMGFLPDSTDAVDMWHWKATRTVGYADDQWAGAVVFGEETTGRANDSKDSGGYVDNVNEAGDAPRFTYPAGISVGGPLFADQAVEITSDMTFEIGQTIPFYLQARPVGSRGDISVSARYVSAEDGSGWWYVVLSRALSTGNPDDAVFTFNSENTFGVALFNNSGDHTHNDGRLVLAIGE
ncbi:MAG: hypothetical protein HXY41_06300 [Chloroflexi bacterium]|nr:hypothetical protein [Chloroflexota bacterium]